MTAATERIPFVLCDVFAERPLAGNQLAVFPEAERIPEELLQKLTRETNFSEAAFLYPPQQGGDARIRIFEPDHETPFAGHPVLGSAIVWATSRGRSSVTLETGRGKVPVELRDLDERGGRGRTEQPIAHVSPFGAARQLLDAR